MQGLVIRNLSILEWRLLEDCLVRIMSLIVASLS